MEFRLALPSLSLVPSYCAALREGAFTPMQLGFGAATADQIEKDPKAYIETLIKAAPFNVTLGDSCYQVHKHEILWIAAEDRFLGAVALRYDADASVIEDWAGHIGMAMRPHLVNRGFGVRSLHALWKQLAGRFEQRGLFSILATCSPQNRASCRLIEHFGGVLIREKVEALGKGPWRLYRIDLPPEPSDVQFFFRRSSSQ